MVSGYQNRLISRALRGPTISIWDKYIIVKSSKVNKYERVEYAMKIAAVRLE